MTEEVKKSETSFYLTSPFANDQDVINLGIPLPNQPVEAISSSQVENNGESKSKQEGSNNPKNPNNTERTRSK